MGKNINLSKGYNIKIKGDVENAIVKNVASSTYAIKPTDFFGIAPIPKLVPEIGTEVKAGDPLLYDKRNEKLVYTAPVSGEVVELRRGAKRSVAEVVILADQNQQYKQFGSINSGAGKEAIKERLIESGAWHFLRQRPFNTSANPADQPKGIFISGFNTAPMAVPMNIALKGKEDYFQAGLSVLAAIAPVHLSVEKGNNVTAFQTVKDAEVHTFSGPHPAGNVGIQIHHISPMRKGEIAWTINAQDVAVIGQLAKDGIYKPERVISVAGNGLADAGYYSVIQGVNIADMVASANEDVRIIDGDVLTGKAIKNDGFLGFYSDQISVIKEGEDYEMLGWLIPSYPRPTRNKSFLGSFFRNKPFDVNTNMHGERRAFVVSGEYEKVLPMNIFPVQLLKAILANDFEGMEGLGIYELVEEDLALCEFVCTSKQPVQNILRNGLDYIREQG